MIDASSFPESGCNYGSSSSLFAFSSNSSSSSRNSHHHHGNGDAGSEFSCSPSTSSTDTTGRQNSAHRNPSVNVDDNIRMNMNKPHRSHDEAWICIRNLRSKLRGNPIGMEHFKLLRRVGYGDIGTVYLTQLRDSHCFYAMKVTDKEALIQRKKIQRVYREREVLEVLDHPFLPTLYAHFETEQLSCLVMDFCSGGDLHVLRHKQPGKRFGLKAVRFYAAEVLIALEYLHMLGIVYRDLKPENVLVRDDGHIMLTDFDLSVRCEVHPKLSRCPLSYSSSISSSSAAAASSTRFSLLRSFSFSSSSSSFSSAGSNLQQAPSPNSFTCFAAIHNRKTQEAQKHRKRFLSTLFRRKGKVSKAKTMMADAEEPEKEMSGDTSEKGESNGADTVGMASFTMKQDVSNSKRVSDACGDNEGAMKSMELIAEPTDARSMSFVGTHEYLAPEVIAGRGHGSAVDWWTFGILMFELLYGSTPFKGSANEQTLMNIARQELSFPEMGHGDTCDAEQNHARNLIRGLLDRNPRTRLGSSKGAAEIKQHPFFRGVNWALIRNTEPPTNCVNRQLKRSRSASHHRQNLVHVQLREDPKIRSSSKHFEFF